MDMLRKSIDESNKVMEGIASALTEIGKGIGAGLAALANSFNPSPQTYPQYSQSHSSQQVVPGSEVLQQFMLVNGLLDSSAGNSFSSENS